MSVRPVHAERYRITLEYTDGYSGTVDLSSIFGRLARKPLVLEILRGQLFGKCFVESGAPVAGSA